MMTANRMKMMALLTEQDRTCQEIADKVGVAYQTVWRWIEQQIDLGNVVVVLKGKGSEATRFAWAGECDEQGRTLLYRAADYLYMRAADENGKQLGSEISAWLGRTDAMMRPNKY